MKAVLIATLGAEPQVISLATQTLVRQDAALSAVVVLHTHAAYEPVATALPLLQNFFATQPVWPPLHPVLTPVDDVLEPAQFEQFSQSLYTVLKTWIARPARIHLLLAGGRKPMAMLGMSVAQLVCGPDDRVWYLHSDEALRKSGRMLMEPRDHVQLIEIPLSRFTAAPPLFTRPFQAATPSAARDVLAEEQRQRLQHFVQHELTAAEREVAALVAQDVLTVKEIAAHLHKSPKTVTNQLNTIYSKLESTFGLQPDLGVKREFLRRALGEYFNK
ncbi:MAG: CRISPR-associated ring nuclease [Caldilineaceae bacterium]